MKNKKLLITLTVLLCCVNLFSQESIVFDKALNWEGGGAGARDIKQTEDGGYVCVGGAGWEMFDVRYLIFKLDSLGNLLWQNYFSTKNSELEAVDITKTGDFITAGKNQNNDDWLNVATLIMFDQNGDTIWLRQYPMEAEIEEESMIFDTYLYDVIYTSDNSIVAAGIAGYGSDALPYIFKTDINGDTLWTYLPLPFQEGNQILILSIAETPEGDYVAVGKADKQVYGEDKNYAPQRGIIIKLSSDGELIYFKEWIDLEYNLFDDLYCLANGDLLIAGEKFVLPTSQQHGYFNSLVVKTDENGNTLFIKSFFCGEYNNISARSIVSDGDNIYIQNGIDVISYDEEWSNDIVIQKLTNEGDLIFQKSIGGQDISTWYGEIITTKDNGIAFSGQTNAGIETGPFAWVVKMDSLGNGNYSPGWISEVITNTFENKIDIFPNPAFNLININLVNQSDCTFTLFTLEGKEIKKQFLNSTQNTVDLEFIPNGVYILQIANQKQRHIQKIIINH